MRRTGFQWVVLGLVGLVLLNGLLDLVPTGAMPPSVRVAFHILLIAALLWISEAVPLYVTSFLVLFLCLTWLQPGLGTAEGGVADPAQFLAPFFSNIILLFLGGFVLSAALHKYHLDQRLALWIIRKSGGSVSRLMMGVMLITAFLSMWLSNTATAAMMLALMLPMLEGLPKGAPARIGLLLSVPFAANIGGLGTPIGSPPNAIALQYLRQMDWAPTFLEWMMIGVPGTLSLLLLAWGLLRWMFKVGGMRVSGESAAVSGTMSPAHWGVLGVALLTVVGWMTGAWHGMATGTVALIPLMVFFGAGWLRVADLRALSWDVLMLMGGGLCLGQAMSASGLAAWGVALLPVEGVSVYWLAVMFGTVACLMSCLMSNTATANLILPMVLGLGAGNLTPVMVAVAFACSIAMALPISTPPNAMAFSSGTLKVSDMVKPGTMLTLTGLVLVFSLGYWWWHWLDLW